MSVPDYGSLDVLDLYPLACGTAWERSTLLSFWGYELPNGRYTAEATVKSTLGSFARKRPDFLDELNDVLRPQSDAVRDFSAESNTIFFRVGKAK